MKEILYSQGDPYLKISVRDKKVVFIGKGSKSRDLLREILNIRGAYICVKVSRVTDLLITDNSSENTKNMQRAKEFGVKIMKYDEVFK